MRLQEYCQRNKSSVHPIILPSGDLEPASSNNNTATPYVWRGATVSDILSKPEYMGHTVNFRSYKESYKDKRAKKTPKEDWVIFKNTQEAIVSEEMWNKVQGLRKTARRTVQSVKPIHLRDCCIVPIAVRKCITIVAEQEGQEIGKGN